MSNSKMIEKAPVLKLDANTREVADQGSGLLQNLLLKVGGVIFVTETLIMLMFAALRPSDFHFRDAALDASLLTLISSVPLYFWVLRPLELKLRDSMKQLEVARAHAEHLSQVDPLTGVYNRRVFFERFESEWDRAARYGTALSCIMLDLDHFKELNDSHGHLAGDAALRVVGKTLRALCRTSDVVCRYGGEEFCVIFPETTEKEAVLYAERIRESLAARQVVYGGGAVKISASFGVAQLSNRMTFPDNLIENADMALIESKKNGRNRVSKASDLSTCDPVPPVSVTSTEELPSTIPLGHS